MVESKDAILKRGWVEVHAVVGGIRQRHVLDVHRQETMWGMVPFLVCKVPLPPMELVRLAEELQLPVKAGGTTAFPRGKGPKDFAEKQEESEEKESEDEGEEEGGADEEEKDGADEEAVEGEEETEEGEAGGEEEGAGPEGGGKP